MRDHLRVWEKLLTLSSMTLHHMTTHSPDPLLLQPLITLIPLEKNKARPRVLECKRIKRLMINRMMLANINKLIWDCRKLKINLKLRKKVNKMKNKINHQQRLDKLLLENSRYIPKINLMSKIKMNYWTRPIPKKNMIWKIWWELNMIGKKRTPFNVTVIWSDMKNKS